MSNEHRQWLESLLDKHGSDLTRWPDQEAARKARLTAMEDHHFRRTFDAARRLDRSFDGLVEHVDATVTQRRSPAMQEVILRQVASEAAGRRPLSILSLQRLAASVVLACAIGMALGEWAPIPAQQETEAFDQLLFASGPTQSAERE